MFLGGVAIVAWWNGAQEKNLRVGVELRDRISHMNRRSGEVCRAIRKKKMQKAI